MRSLLCSVLGTALVVTACGRREAPANAGRMDTAGPAADSSAADARADTNPPAIDSAAAARLVGTWSAQGYDSGSTRPQPFTITWNREPDGALKGTIAFREGEKYDVKVVSATGGSVVYESDRHRSPTLKTEVVTRTEARLSGDSLAGTYEARATQGDKTLRGRFTAKRGAGR